jgi:hypothetical protein
MINKTLYILIFFISVTLSECYAQNDSLKPHKILPYKHSIGFQINQYYSSHYLHNNKFPTVFAIRYGYQLKNNIRFGIEYSLWHEDIPYYKSDINRIGLFVRYSFLRKTNFQPFVEANVFYFYQNSLYSNNGQGYQDVGGGFDYFLAPGLTIYFLKKHISFDFLLKWNHKNKNQFPLVFSYRFSYHFNRIKFK